MKYPDKFHLTPEQNLFLAKKKWDENVYCGMKMENRNVTFPQTKTILDGINVPDVKLNDIYAIKNMRNAWEFFFSTINEPITLEYFCKLNEYIAIDEALVWVALRTGVVEISGTDYKPPIPNTEEVRGGMSEILNSNSTATEKALSIFSWGTRGQFFWDGNKRTSLILANKVLIENGAGMMIIPEKQMLKFNEVLSDYYNTSNKESLEDFLYNEAICGIEF